MSICNSQVYACQLHFIDVVTIIDLLALQCNGSQVQCPATQIFHAFLCGEDWDAVGTHVFHTQGEEGFDGTETSVGGAAGGTSL